MSHPLNASRRGVMVSGTARAAGFSRTNRFPGLDTQVQLKLPVSAVYKLLVPLVAFHIA